MKKEIFEPRLEREIIKEEEKEKEVKKLREIIKEISQRLGKENGIQLTNDCRIEMESFKRKGIYSDEEMNDDIKLIKKCQKKFWGKVHPNEEFNNEKYQKERLMSKGEQLEILKTYIFYKFLPKNFLAIRASLYDDFINKVDNIILEKETGNIVCAFDEVGDMKGKEYTDKTQEVLKRDTEGGVRLKYGLGIKENKQLFLTELKSLPLFYLCLDEEMISEIIKNLESLENPVGQKTEFEKNIFDYFKASLRQQSLDLYHLDVDAKVSQYLDKFKDDLERW